MSGRRAPKRVGRYLLFDPIASGGMGTVHIGKMVGAVGFSRIVAIKSLHPHLARDPAFLSMLMDEARLAARIRHPNVVSVLDVVRSSRDLLLVLEYIEGESLSRLIEGARQRRLAIPPRLAVSVLVQVLTGLHAAHEARNDRGDPIDLVHRDVSPQNILVGVDGLARITDFGVAKATERMQVTQTGQIKGKLAYLSREQLLLEPVDRRTDVYAASVVLWETITGTDLFDGTTDLDVRDLILRGAVQPPSALTPSVSPELDAVILRGLALHASDRYPTAAAMAEALEHVIGGVASSREMTQAVRELAHDSLAKRARMVARAEREQEPADVNSRSSPEEQTVSYGGEVEAGVATADATMAATDSVSAAGLVPKGAVTASASYAREAPAGLVSESETFDDADSEAGGEVDSVPVESVVTPTSPRSSGVALAVLAGLVLAGLVIAGALVLVRRPEPSPPVRSGSGAMLVPASVDAPVEPSATAPIAPDAMPAASVTAAPVESIESAVPTPIPATIHVRTPKQPPESCTPPYTVDSKGVRIPKRHCYR